MKSDNLKLEKQLCFALYSTMQAINKCYAPLLKKLKLTYPQYLVMLILWEEDNITVKNIGERLYLDSGTITPLLKRLESAGLISRQRNPKDEREVLISLTKKGSSINEKAKEIPPTMMKSMGLNSEELKSFKDKLIKLRSTLQKN